MSAVTAQITIYDNGGSPIQGAIVNYQLVSAPYSSGAAYCEDPQTATSGEDGLVQFPVLPGATYQISLGCDDPITVNVPFGASNPFMLPETLID